MRLGLYGGSFDPVHLGHLLVAQAAREELALDRICFIPAAQSPFKRERQPAPATLRMQMLRLALAGDPAAVVDTQEIGREGISYTIETIRDYRRRHLGAELFWLIGSDHVPTLPGWQASAKLAEMVVFIVIPRPGQVEVPLPPPFRGCRLRGFPLGVSSSQIRSRVKEGLSIHHLVPDAVAEVIRNNRLYL
jgi:nicotinate-nucleotide adenylyltransferase